MGANESNPNEVAFVVNSERGRQDELWLYAVDGNRVRMEPIKREHYAITPGRHVLWVLAPMKVPTGPVFWPFGESRPNRCFEFEVDLQAGKVYYLAPLDNTKKANLVTNDTEADFIPGRLVDESWWTCHWHK